MKVTFVIKADVGIGFERDMENTSKNISLADFERNATLFPPFDVIENLEKYAGVSANIPLFVND